MSTTEHEAKEQGSKADKEKTAKSGDADKAVSSSDPTEKVTPVKDGSMARTAPRAGRRTSGNRPFVGSAAAAAAATRSRTGTAPAGATVGAERRASAPASDGTGTQPRQPREAAYADARYPSGAASVGAAANGRVGRVVGPRRVKLTMQRIDPWSAMKISFLVSVALGIASVVMVGAVWLVLQGMGVFGTVNDFIVQVTSGEDAASSFDLMDYIGLGRVLLLAVVFGVINVFLLTALSTLTAFLYNVCSALVGGMALTLSDE